MNKTLAALLFALCACGGDEPEPKYRVTVACEFTCNGELFTSSVMVCDTEEAIHEPVATAVDDCEADLSGRCNDWSCVCEYPADVTQAPKCD